MEIVEEGVRESSLNKEDEKSHLFPRYTVFFKLIGISVTNSITQKADHQVVKGSLPEARVISDPIFE